ncbi:hypothetical protein [Vibrio tetraodonis]|uniref:hypothetical protein n=1 Tax=Vibrio tetraodonis TaxID=2231647 RepID=UPI00136B69D3|nr:hypothetical protein [Vibrio tetraodonis]
MHQLSSIHVLPESPYLTYLHTQIWNKHVSLSLFREFSDQVTSLVLVQAPELLSYSGQPTSELSI